MKRRALAFAGVAAAAGAAGLGAALWRRRPDEAPAAAGDLWSQRFARPDGGELSMAGLRGRPVLLNFWATWCPPCVRELPLLDRFGREHSAAGWQVVGLAVDKPEPVRAFLERQPVGFAIGLVGADGVELSLKLGNRSGALPFSVVFDRKGRLVERKLGVIEPADLQRWVAAVA